MTGEPLIVGIDPGNTSAVAAVDFDGELKLLESSREFPPEEIIERLIEVGTPVVVASDREKMPSTVEKIASSLGASKFQPEEDLAADRKKELGGGENSHEQDAAASALYAYNNLRRRIEKIEKDSGEKKDRLEVAKSYFSPGKPAQNQSSLQ